MEVKKRQTYLKFYSAYTLIFIIMAYFVFYAFWKLGKSFIWSNDGVASYVPYMYYFIDYFIDIWDTFWQTGRLQFAMMDFSVGLGDDIIGFFRFPWYIFALLFGKDHLELGYTIYVLLLYYLAGAMFAAYCFCKKKDSYAILIGSLIYAFCGFALFAGVRHPFFLEPMVLLPLLLIGLDNILEKKGWRFFTVIVCISMVCSYYFLYMNTILMAVYTLLRWSQIYNKNQLKDVLCNGLCIIGSYLLGIGMSMVIALPTIFLFFQSVRGTGGVAVDNFWYYPFKYYLNFFVTLIIPAYWPGSWTRLGFAPITLLAIGYMFFQKKKYKIYKFGFLILTIFLGIPVFGYIMGGFSNLNNRWCFGYAFLIALIVVNILPDLQKASGKNIWQLTCLTMAYFFALWFCNKSFNVAGLLAFAMLMVGLCLLGFDFKIFNNEEKIKQSLILGAVCLSLILGGYGLYDEKSKKYVMEFMDWGSLEDYYSGGSMEEIRLLNDNEFFRVERMDTPMSKKNDSAIFGFLSTASFSSVQKRELLEYYKDLENRGVVVSIRMSSLDGRSIMEQLACVRYFFPQKDEAKVPYGYEEKKAKSAYQGKVYENKYPMPLGFTYQKAINESEYLKLNTVSKQEALLQTIVLEDDKLATFSVDALNIVNKKIPYEIIEMKNVVWENGKINVKKANGSIQIAFQGMPNAETYLRFSQLIAKQAGSGMDVVVEASGMKKTLRVIGDNDAYSYGAENYLVNMGYDIEPLTTCTIYFEKKGVYILGDIEVYCQPMDNYVEQVNELRAEKLENVYIGKNYVYGDISVSKDKWLFLSIPYSRGWSAKVDGESTEILKANTMFMALPLEAGYHEIELNYCTPGVKAGIVISLLSLGIFIVLSFVGRYRKKR